MIEYGLPFLTFHAPCGIFSAEVLFCIRSELTLRRKSMKRLALFFALGILSSTNFILAAPSTSSVPSATPPLVHAINQRIKNQMKLTQLDVKSGKLTKEQARSIRASLRNIRLQEFSFFKQNKSHSLTPDQISQLNQSLDKNSSLVGETPGSSN